MSVPHLNGEVTFGKSKITLDGEWGMGKDAKLKSTFEMVRKFDPKTCKTDCEKLSGNYDGYFHYQGGHGAPQKVQELEFNLMFTPNQRSASTLTIKGQGKNKFGSYGMRGTAVKGKWTFNILKQYKGLAGATPRRSAVGTQKKSTQKTNKRKAPSGTGRPLKRRSVDSQSNQQATASLPLPTYDQRLADMQKQIDDLTRTVADLTEKLGLKPFERNSIPVDEKIKKIEELQKNVNIRELGPVIAMANKGRAVSHVTEELDLSFDRLSDHDWSKIDEIISNAHENPPSSPMTSPLPKTSTTPASQNATESESKTRPARHSTGSHSSFGSIESSTTVQTTATAMTNNTSNTTNKMNTRSQLTIDTASVSSTTKSIHSPQSILKTNQSRSTRKARLSNKSEGGERKTVTVVSPTSEEKKLASGPGFDLGLIDHDDGLEDDDDDEYHGNLIQEEEDDEEIIDGEEEHEQDMEIDEKLPEIKKESKKVVNNKRKNITKKEEKNDNDNEEDEDEEILELFGAEDDDDDDDTLDDNSNKKELQIKADKTMKQESDKPPVVIKPPPPMISSVPTPSPTSFLTLLSKSKSPNNKSIPPTTPAKIENPLSAIIAATTSKNGSTLKLKKKPLPPPPALKKTTDSVFNSVRKNVNKIKKFDDDVKQRQEEATKKRRSIFIPQNPKIKTAEDRELSRKQAILEHQSAQKEIIQEERERLILQEMESRAIMPSDEEEF
eukprot:TRINITY_DN2782_c0_g2_i1.p1 TRINITY_DN2782_c0_g2~~TRINITY_DN2782_c0_g2_i1.p1  ORF type:complete len:724 (-),score=248.25 TRINITY_DN2782_c0_g2_i1:915-3086(-)